LRHTFGTLAINRADPVSVQHWMGHANLQTTMRYLHFRQRDDEADLLSEAFEENRVPNLVPKSADLGLSEDNSERKDLRNQPQSN
jgi:hypothetical protein